MTKSLLSIVVVLISMHALYGQVKSQSDSLDVVLSSLEGLDRYETLINKVRIIASTDYNAALPVVDEAYEIAGKFGDSAKLVQSGRIKGQILNYLDRRNESIDILNEVLPVAQRHNLRHDLKLIFSNLANAYTFRADYGKSLDLHFKVLALNEEDNDQTNMGFTYNNIGLVYYKMKNYNEAIEYYGKALEVQQGTQDRFEIGKLLINIGNCYNSLHEYSQARKYFEMAAEECKRDCSMYFKLDGNLGLGVSSFNTGEIEKAQEHFLISLETAKEVGNQRFAAENNYWLGRVHLIAGNKQRAVEYFKTAEVVAEAESLNQILIQVYQALYSLYEENNNHDEFANYVKKFIALKDEVYNEEVMESLAKSRADYEQRVNLAIIKANELTIAQQQRLYTAALIIAVLSALLVVVLLLAYRAVKKVNRKLSNAQDVIFEQNRKLNIRNEELDRMVEKKTEELKMVNLTLKQMNDELDTFILKSAEDIRAPLASLRGICYVALMDVTDKTSLLYLQKINKTTELLHSILKRLLALNKINHSKPSMAEIDMHALIDQVIAMQIKKGLPENLVVRKNIVENASIQTDKELMSIVLENTIDNALKNCDTSVNREHFIEINVAASNNGRVNVRVIDNREGARDFSSTDVYNIFKGSELAADQAEAEKQDLYFVKAAAKKIGGKVNVGKTAEGYNELTLVF